MIRSLIHYVLAASVCLLASPQLSAVGQNCAAMEDSGPQWFAAKLDKVQATYKGGKSREAYQQLWQAMIGLPRSADVSLEARCVGPVGWQRMYQLRRAITSTLGKQAENVGKLANPEGALDWYVLGDNRGDAERVVPELTPTAEGTAWIISRLQTEIGSLNHAQESGFELLPEERAAREFWQGGLDGTIRYARQVGKKTLALEAKIVTRNVTMKELEIEDAQDSTRMLVAQFYDDESLATENEAQREINRAKASLGLLRKAESWFQAISVAEAGPTRARALGRGDALMTKADDPALGLEARDSLYEAASNYFEFSGNSERQQTAERGRSGIAPALKAERDARSARAKKKNAELQQSSQQMKKSMQKTDTQKEHFQNEADALEAELGF